MSPVQTQKDRAMMLAADPSEAELKEKHEERTGLN